MKKILSLLSILGVLNSFAQTITGTGTVNYLPKFTNSTVIGNSIISQGSGNNLVGIGTTSPRATLDIIRQCGANNLAAILIEQDILVGNCPGGQTLGTDYFVVRTFNSITSAYQHYFYVNGNGRVALGNNSAATQLDVQALSSNDPFQLRNNSGSTLLRVLASGNIGVRTASPAGPLDIRNSSNAILMQLNSTGNLSIGNITPTYRLDVNCQQSGAAQPPFRFVNYLGNVTMVGTNSDRVGINVANPDTYGGSLVVGAVGTGGNALDLISTSASGWCNQLRFYSASGVRHLITDDRTNNYLLIKTGNGGGANSILKIEGKVRIGNQAPNGSWANYQLGVDGDLVAKRVVVQTANWADNVFNEDYPLATLEAVDAFIKSNKHLPEVPTEDEVLKNGVDVGSMNRILLQKVEELTLYVIDLKKEINELKR